MSKRRSSNRLRRSARGQDCTLRIASVCNYNPETTVLCHLSFADGSKGVGQKTSDMSAVYGCWACHDELDAHRIPEVDRWYYVARAIVRTHEAMLANGDLVAP